MGERSCTDCKFAEWRTDGPKATGRCRYQIAIATPVPACIDLRATSIDIFRHWLQKDAPWVQCPTWEKAHA